MVDMVDCVNRYSPENRYIYSYFYTKIGLEVTFELHNRTATPKCSALCACMYMHICRNALCIHNTEIQMAAGCNFQFWKLGTCGFFQFCTQWSMTFFYFLLIKFDLGYFGYILICLEVIFCENGLGVTFWTILRNRNAQLWTHVGGRFQRWLETEAMPN